MSFKGVVIDAGHGGSDGGASNGSFIEKDYTLKISNYIHDRLDQLGVENSLVRNNDVTLNPSDRVVKIKSFYGDGRDVLLISNHINAGGGEGAEVIYALRNNDKFSKIISDNLSSSNRYVRKYYQKRYPSDTSKDYYFIHRDTGNIEAVIVEYGFLDNDNDKKLLEKNWKEYAEIVVKSICEYIGVPYKEEVMSGEYYIVQKGDTLWSIAKKYNISVDKLKDINNLNSDNLSIGQKLIVNKTDTSDDIYVVQKGDTLWSIAKKFNLSVDKLKDINNLNSNMLSIGQKLLIKDNQQYVVKKGDTLYSIAKNNGLTVDDLIKKNNLSSVNLAIGQKLYL